MSLKRHSGIGTFVSSSLLTNTVHWTKSVDKTIPVLLGTCTVECDYATRVHLVATPAAAAAASLGGLSLINGTAGDVPYSLLNAATVGTGSASSVGRQLRQHKVSIVDVDHQQQQPYDSSLTAAASSSLSIYAALPLCSRTTSVICNFVARFVTRLFSVPFTFMLLLQQQLSLRT